MPTGKELLAQQNVDSRATIPASPEAPSRTLQDVQNKIEIAKAELILAEIQGQRELPDKIKQRDEASLQREQSVKQKEDAIESRELSVSERERAMIAAELSLTDKVKQADSRIKQLTSNAEALRTEADTYYHDKVSQGDALDASIEAKQTELEQVTTSITTEVQLLVKQIRKWASIANVEATRSHFAAERNGPDTKYQTQRSTVLWQVESELRKIWRSLGG